MAEDFDASAPFHSPQHVADVLGLHVRTVRRYLREGRLDAVRIGNRYRIPHQALEAFAGRPVGPSDADQKASTHIDVSSVVDIQPITREMADRLTTLLIASAQRGDDDRTHLRLDVAYEPDRERLKVVIAGTAANASAVLALITAYMES